MKPKNQTEYEALQWQGKLSHAKEDCWGCIRDEAGDRIITVSIPDRNDDDAVLASHRRNETDPTQCRIDAILDGLNSHHALVEQNERLRGALSELVKVCPNNSATIHAVTNAFVALG